MPLTQEQTLKVVREPTDRMLIRLRQHFEEQGNEVMILIVDELIFRKNNQLIYAGRTT